MTIGTTAELDDAPAVAQRVQRVGVHSERDEIAGTQCAALIAKSIQRCIEIPGFHGG